ncbi:MAG: methyltransferase [Proteobacteria bacterium]|nr:MAG: methyltransferase [Pseudomonadota bacterium]
MLNSKRKLRPRDAARFANAEPALFAELATVLCKTEILPEKELHECWQMAQHVHQTFPDAPHIADLAAGHGLLSWILVLIARVSETAFPRTAVAVDIKRPKAAEILAEAITNHWIELRSAVSYVEGSIESVVASNGPNTLFVATHACGSLSDRVLLVAIGSGSSLALMPCCHSLRKQTETLSSISQISGVPMQAIASKPESIDLFRKRALRSLGYTVSEASIDAEITAYNHMILGKAPEHSLTQDSKAEANLSRPLKVWGEIRAFEKIHRLDVSNREDATLLASRPPREWVRFFDLSFWVRDESERVELEAEMRSLAAAHTVDTKVIFQDQFLHPTTQRLSTTFRVELKSSAIVISKEDALALRQSICEALKAKYDLRA